MTDESGIHAFEAVDSTGRWIGPWRGASGVGPETVVKVITETGHSRTQIEHPTHSPTWMGRSISQGIGPSPGPASTPGDWGRDMSSASTGQTSMQIPQLMQFDESMSIR